MDRVKRIWYLLSMRAAKVQASLRIRAVSPEPPLLAHTSSESRGTFRQKARSLAPLNGWACAVKIYYDGMLEDTNSLDGAHIANYLFWTFGMKQFFLIFHFLFCFSLRYSTGLGSASEHAQRCSYNYYLWTDCVLFSVRKNLPLS